LLSILRVDIYFEHMLKFYLFRRSHFDSKVRAIKSLTQAKALLASMFSFSERFFQIEVRRDQRNADDGPAVDVDLSNGFHRVALRSIEEALEDSSEEAPPLCILQAMTITTYQQLIQGVHGRAWRSLGSCIRIAYEHHLHLIDSRKSEHGQDDEPCSVEQWVLDEERRRTWWAIWEFDVFASTTRRLPTAIDWTQNETFLPVDDNLWINDTIGRSCRLEVDPSLRLEMLQKSGNYSYKAWYIVLNSIMRNAQMLSNPRGMKETSRQRGKAGHSKFTSSSQRTKPSEEGTQRSLAILANVLASYAIALPPHLAYRDEPLLFKNGGMDYAKHSIHITIQLTRFMIHQYETLRLPFKTTTPRFKAACKADNSRGTVDNESTNEIFNSAAWAHYLAAADNIITLIRNCPPHHIRHSNPFLASVIWLAAVVQIVHKAFGPKPEESSLIESNYELLRLNFRQYVSFWDISDTLRQRLDMIEARLYQRGAHDVTFPIENAGSRDREDSSVSKPIIDSVDDGQQSRDDTTTQGISRSLNEPSFDTSQSPAGYQASGYIDGAHSPIPSFGDTPYPLSFDSKGEEDYGTLDLFWLDDALMYGYA
jgi:Fungal specific transcription factor domain